MARNKYPEQTVERILEVSARLFWEKGYENTSIQDILNELKDLTKGAIYHHFKSKEEIFDAVATREGEKNHQYFVEMQKDTSRTGAEKLREIVRLHIASDATRNIVHAAPSLLENPKFLAIQLKQIHELITPCFILPIVEEGIADGSIRTDKPYALAEAIVLLINVWLNPLILGRDTTYLVDKCALMNEFLAQYHITLFDADCIRKLESFQK